MTPSFPTENTQPHMRRYFRILVLTTALLPSLLPAQPSTNPPKEESIVLSPFTVSTERDTGFVAASSLAGGRLASDLKDTAADYSVLTGEFIDALNLTNLSDAVKWTVNSNNIVETLNGVDGGVFGNGPAVAITFRGTGSNSLQLDFFPVPYNYDTFSVERLDFARGANAVLFGAGSFGGTPNAVSKRARLGSTKTETKLTFGTFDLARAAIDVNVPISPKLAARINLLEQKSGGFFDRQQNDRQGAQLGLRFDPTRTTTLNFSGDVGAFVINSPAGNQNDQLSGWNGTTVSTTPQFAAALGSNAQGVIREGTNNYYLVNTTGDLRKLINYSGQARTQGAGENAQVPVAGVLYVGSLSPGIANQPIAEAINVPGNLLATAIANSKFRPPSRNFSNAMNAKSNVWRYQNYTGTINQQIGKHLFLEGAANYSRTTRRNDLTANGLFTARLDVNQLQPDGSPNPYFLQPYNDNGIQRLFIDSESKNVRAGAVAQFEGTKWGDFRLSVMAGENYGRTYNRREVLIYRDPNVDPRLWASTTTVRARYYWYQPSRPSLFDGLGEVPLVDPLTGTTRTLPTSWSILYNNAGGFTRNSSDTRYWQAALTAKTWKNRLNLLAAARHDDFTIIADNNLTQLGLPRSADGTYGIFRPKAPNDYNALLFTPKDTAGVVNGSRQAAITRPRDAAGNPLPQYANDRFQDDYRVPDVNAGKTVFSFGSVLHVTKWLSLQASYGETFNPPPTNPRIDFRSFDPVSATTTSGGVRLYLLGGKINVTLNRYEGTQANTPVGIGTDVGFPAAADGILNNIINANNVGDTSPDGRNQRGLPNVPQNFRDFAQRKIKGTELEIVANLSRQWRLLFNAALPEAVQTDANSDIRDYIDKNKSVLRDIVTDAGGLIGADDIAVANTGSTGIDTTAAVNGWNQLMAVRRGIITGPVKVARLNRYQANLYSDYTIGEGALKGVKFGLGANVRGPEIIGNRASDTIRNPANPNAAIDDPKYDATSMVWRSGFTTATADLSYSFKVAKKYQTTVALRVDNLLDFDKPLYAAVSLRAPGGDVTNPARVATPVAYGFTPTRTFQISATLRF